MLRNCLSSSRFFSSKKSTPKVTKPPKESRFVKGNTLSSTLWLRRQLSDPYVKKAHHEGLHSRAAYKLLEIQEKHKLFWKGAVVVDLGAAPGGWTQIAVDQSNSDGRDESSQKGIVVSVDSLEMPEIPGAIVLQGDFFDSSTQRAILTQLKGRRVNVLLSDMAPNTSGQTNVDHLRIMDLVESAWDFGREVMCEGGKVLFKVWQGGQEAKLREELSPFFRSVKFVKPPASRSSSAEIYLLGIGFRRSNQEES